MNPYINTHVKGREAAALLVIVAGAAAVAVAGVAAMAVGKAVLRLRPFKRKS